MTNSIEAAAMELTPPGREVTQAEQDSWLKTRRYKFDPRQPISDLAARLLVVSNAIHGVR